MISASHLPNFKYEQLIHPNRISTIQDKIVEANRNGEKVAIVSFGLTPNEESYLTLYGYRVFTNNTGTRVFWTHY